MIRFLKRIAVKTADWLLYSVLTEKQKKALANLFTEKQINRIKSRLKVGKKRSQMLKVDRIKYKLYTLGFTEKALADLKSIINGNDHSVYMKQLAAWELALWYANQYSEEGARRCLDYLTIATKDIKDQEILRKAAILKAESYDMLNEIEEAKAMIKDALASQTHADLYLAAANLEKKPADRINWINKSIELYGNAPIKLAQDETKTAYDNIKTDIAEQIIQQENKVSVIIPVYNAETTVQTAIESVLAQTWTNLEILVVDDQSTDQTKQVIEKYAEQDSRISVLQTNKNGGAYVARNTALGVATGEFVTINDADDWSHPEKIKTQVEHLLKNAQYIGNTSMQARSTEDLKFYRRGQPGNYMFNNMSSFMFRRKPVMDKIGYWDSVRFAGDSEFIKRIKIIFGEKSIAALKTAPFSFQRQSGDSLTGNSAFGFPGFFMGARKEYLEAHEHYHSTNPDKLNYDFPQKNRPFPVPEPMWPNREEKENGKRHFDVIIASEFRLPGGTNMSNIEEIKAQEEMGIRTGLIQINRYDLQSVEKMNPKVRELIDGDQVQMLVYGEKVTCDVLIIRHPPVLQEWQKYIPEVEAKEVRVIANQTPKKEYSETGTTLYDLKTTSDRTKAYFGKDSKWHPIGPLIREVFEKQHKEDLKYIDLADDDWINIINTKEWKRPAKPNNEKIKIGRHSRDQYVKWPVEKEELLTVYPPSSTYEIHVLGGAKMPAKVLGQLPSNWHVYEFGEKHPKDFLAALDVFVYYTHPDLVEAFGRVIFEAMAVGVPVIIPPNYKVLFGDAAIYAEPAEVEEKIKQLMQDEELYDTQAEKAYKYVEQHFGHPKHMERLKEIANG